MDYRQEFQSKLITAEDAARKIKSNDRVFLSPVAGTPIDILEALTDRYKELENVELFSALLMYPMPFLIDPDYAGHIRYNTLFLGPLERKVYPIGLITHDSVHFSSVDSYIKDVMRPDVSLIGVSPMDEEGYMYFGPMGVSACGCSARTSALKIVQVTSEIPRTRGDDNKIHISDVDFIVEKDFPLAPLPEAPISDIDREIAKHIVPRIRDGSTLQVGLGGLSNAVAYSLENKKDLGVHTEMITESMMYLAKKGVINRKMVGGFALGSNDLYQYSAQNKNIYLAPIYEVNRYEDIYKYDNFVSINTCLMIDITGQIASEGVGTKSISSIGGASDFVRGASHSKGGQSFICVASTAELDGVVTSNIVFALPLGTIVTVNRADVQYVVTEYGIADLYNKPVHERVQALIAIAHPDFCAELEAQAREAGYIS